LPSGKRKLEGGVKGKKKIRILEFEKTKKLSEFGTLEKLENFRKNSKKEVRVEISEYKKCKNFGSLKTPRSGISNSENFRKPVPRSRRR
jgi:hypothetical protein